MGESRFGLGINDVKVLFFLRCWQDHTRLATQRLAHKPLHLRHLSTIAQGTKKEHKNLVKNNRTESTNCTTTGPGGRTQQSILYNTPRNVLNNTIILIRKNPETRQRKSEVVLCWVSEEVDNLGLQCLPIIYSRVNGAGKNMG